LRLEVLEPTIRKNLVAAEVLAVEYQGVSMSDDYGSRGAVALVATAIGLMLAIYAASLLLHSLGTSSITQGPVVVSATTGSPPTARHAVALELD
jgi:hypothetical protein